MDIPPILCDLGKQEQQDDKTTQDRSAVDQHGADSETQLSDVLAPSPYFHWVMAKNAELVKKNKELENKIDHLEHQMNCKLHALCKNLHACRDNGMSTVNGSRHHVFAPLAKQVLCNLARIPL